MGMETIALEREAQTLRQRFDALAIADVREVAPAVLTATMEQTAIIGRVADDFIRKVEASLRPIAKKAHEAHKAAVAEIDRLESPALALKKETGALGWSCNRELERRRAEALRLQQEEQDRLDQQAEELARQETARRLKIEEDARLDRAVALEDSGDQKAADRLLDEPLYVSAAPVMPVFAPPVSVPETPRTSTSYGESWSFEVIDEAAVPREYLMLDEVKIGQVCRALKGRTNIPGIRPVAKPTSRIGRWA